MGETSDFFFQVMQLVVGHDLRTIIAKARNHPVPTKRILPVTATFQYICQILDALGYAHEEGVFHQDIKPANILVDDRFGRALVADFGIARTVWAEYGEKPLLVGTPVYMSPEQAACAAIDGRTDIYSVGVMLFELTAGFLPIYKESVADLIKRKKKEPDTFFTARPSEINSSITRELETIIIKAIAANPDSRFADCTEFKTVLENYLRNGGLK
jgi:eukaryotic-like serine/threonine-protein kinase